ncbi:conserved hypothetical protein [Coccidioides posadasii str. Silveira]|uniref:Uncharacterized protein n=1 Tax=Coccidioides posadasii (strain RMSCC 757 / Silveira) TaxID=443226 RepID=E9DDP5_COCPS|nr:conserved hypothetical protein [Coccidioides posadasii str. Silveira]
MKWRPGIIALRRGPGGGCFEGTLKLEKDLFIFFLEVFVFEGGDVMSVTGCALWMVPVRCTYVSKARSKDEKAVHFSGDQACVRGKEAPLRMDTYPIHGPMVREYRFGFSIEATGSAPGGSTACPHAFRTSHQMSAQSEQDLPDRKNQAARTVSTHMKYPCSFASAESTRAELTSKKRVRYAS